AVALLAADAASLFSRLPQWVVVLLAVGAAVCLGALAVGRSARGAPQGRLRLVLALCLTALLALCGNRFGRGFRMAALPAAAEKKASAELDARASVIQQEFAVLLLQASDPLERGRALMTAFDGSAAHAFDV